MVGASVNPAPARRLTLRDLPPREKGSCRYCGGPVPKGRRSWCSQQCVEEYLIRADTGRARALVFQRDRGVCAFCGLEAGRLDALVEHERRRIRDYVHRNRLHRLFTEPGYALGDASIFARSGGILIFGQRVPFRSASYWEADHVVPVAEGGGACGLDNLRTLCWRCHPKETGKLRRRLNQAANPQRSLLP